jgi:hypothetical protein
LDPADEAQDAEDISYDASKENSKEGIINIYRNNIAAKIWEDYIYYTSIKAV